MLARTVSVPAARGEGFFTVDTLGTKAVIGYGDGKTHELGQLIPLEQTENGLLFTLDGHDSSAVYYLVEILGD